MRGGVVPKVAREFYIRVRPVGVQQVINALLSNPKESDIPLLIEQIKGSRLSASFLFHRSFTPDSQAQFLRNVNNTNDAALALSGGHIHPVIAIKIAKRIHSTRIVAKIFEQGNLLPVVVQEALIGAFKRSNESQLDKSDDASSIISAGNLNPSLTQEISGYIQTNEIKAKGSQTSSEDAAYALSEMRVERSEQIGLVQCINNSHDYAIALSGGLLDEDIAIKLASRIFDAFLVETALERGAEFSLPVQRVLVSVFGKCNSSDKAEIALNLIRNPKIDASLHAELQSYIPSNVVPFIPKEEVSSLASEVSGQAVTMSGQAAKIEDIITQIQSLTISPKEKFNSNISRLNSSSGRMESAPQSKTKAVKYLGDMTLRSRVDGQERTTVKLEDISIEDLTKFLRNKNSDFDINDLKARGVEFLAEKIANPNVSTYASYFYSELVGLAKELKNNGVKSEDLEELFETTHLGQQIWSQVQRKELSESSGLDSHLA
ncbi:MAG: hypothetical protein HOM96_00185 [Rickettsiales bacterium]|nr:hypothetical protein [Rickettsiales bacterium]